MSDTGEIGRASAVRRGELLEYATVAHSRLEGLIGIGVGIVVMAGSIALAVQASWSRSPMVRPRHPLR